MENTNLELLTNEQLIEELLRRSTFRGLIVWQRESYKDTHAEREGDTDFIWRANYCNPARLMRQVLPALPDTEGGAA